MIESSPEDEPQVGDFIVMFDTESDGVGEPPILIVRITADGFEGIGEGWPEQADRLETRARLLAHEQGARAWRHVTDRYEALAPYLPSRDVH